MKLIRKRFLSLLLVLVMVLGMIPAMAPVAEAATVEDQISIRNWDQLVDYLTDPTETRMAFLYNDISHKVGEYDPKNPEASASPTVTVVGQKHLRLRGCDITVDDDSNRSGDGSMPYGSEQLDRTLFVIAKDAKLIIVDEGGDLKGRVRYDAYMADADSEYHVCWRNLFDVYGTLIIDGGIFEAGRELKQFYPFVNNFYQYIFGKVVITHPGSKVEINGGTFIGYGYVPASTYANCNPEAMRACVIQVATEEDKTDYSNNFKVNPATIFINGGEFYGKGGADIFNDNVSATSDRLSGTDEQKAFDGKNRISIAAGYFQVDDRDDIRIETNGVTPREADGSRGFLQIKLDWITNKGYDSIFRFFWEDDGTSSDYHSGYLTVHADPVQNGALYQRDRTRGVEIMPDQYDYTQDRLLITNSVNGELVDTNLPLYKGYKLQYFTDDQEDPNSTVITMGDKTTTTSSGLTVVEDKKYYAYVEDRYGMDQYYEWAIWKGSSTKEDPDHVILTYGNSLNLQKARDINGNQIDWNSDIVWTGKVSLYEYHRSGDRVLDNTSEYGFYMAGTEKILDTMPDPTDEIIQISKGSDFIFDVDVLPFPDAKDAWRYISGDLKCIEPAGPHYYNISIPYNTNRLELGLYDFGINVYVNAENAGYEAIDTVSYKFEIVEGPAALPSGEVVYATSGQIGSPVILGFTGVLKNLHQQKPEAFSFQWQLEKAGIPGWADIEGATKGSYTPKADDYVDVGDNIRVKVMVEGYEGFAVSAPLTVKLRSNLTPPPTAKLEFEPLQKLVYFYNYNANCEYVWARSAIQTAEDFEAATPIAENSFTISEFGTYYYVAARYKETEDTLPGSVISCASIYCDNPSGTNIAATYVRYPSLAATGSEALVYVPVGSSVNIAYVYDPMDANASLVPYFVPSRAGIATITKNSNQTLTIRGSQAGTINVYPANKSTDTQPTWVTAQRRFQSLKVVVYDPANPDASALKDVQFPDYTVALGGTLPAEAPTVWNPDYAAGDLESKFNTFRWYLVESTMTGYKMTTENDYVRINPKTGLITPKKVTTNPVQVEVLAYTASDAAKVDAGTLSPSSGNRIGWYQVHVVESSGQVKLERVDILPKTLDMVVGETVPLQIVLSPTNAYIEGDPVWSSSQKAVATIDSDGVLTAVGEGNTMVSVRCKTVSGVTMTGRLQVTVRADNHNHLTDSWTKLDDTTHQGVCYICGKTVTGEHNYLLKEVVDTPTCSTKGKEIHACAVCGDEKEVALAATGAHSYSVRDYDDNSHWNICANCGKEEPDSRELHTYSRGADGQYLYDYGCEVCSYGGPGGMGGSSDPYMTGFYAVSGGKAIVTPEMKNMEDEDFEMSVTVVQYSSTGQMKAMQTVTHKGGGIVTGFQPFTHAAGDVYKVFTILPNSAEWPNYIWYPLQTAVELTEAKG